MMDDRERHTLLRMFKPALECEPCDPRKSLV